MMRRGLMVGAVAVLAAGMGQAQGKKSSGPDDGLTRIIGIDGIYTGNGRNADGSAYKGRTVITQQGDAVEFTWYIGNDTNRGSGTIEGRVVTVDWGDATPVVYVVMPDGELHGTWADGTALEKLTPQR